MEATASGGAAQIINGYASSSWNLSGGWITTPNAADRIACIFNLLSGVVLQQEATTYFGQFQMHGAAGAGPVMGAGAVIWVNGALSGGFAPPNTYCLNPATNCVGGVNALGGTGCQPIIIGALEGGAIPAAAVPLPAAAPLLPGAVGLTGWVARRRKG
jgi:hypothetical protein